jgi:hypothetical protein
MLDKIKAPPAGHDVAVLAGCGCFPREALTGPMPPGWSVLALIAGPMLGDKRQADVLAQAMALAGDEFVWRNALLEFYPEPKVIDGE